MQLTLTGQIFVKKSYIEFDDNSKKKNGLVADTTSQQVTMTDCRLHTSVLFLLPKKTPEKW
jgi:hypothetical protein